MSVVIRTPRVSRLSKLIDAAGGASVGVALARAKRNLAKLEPRSLEVIRGHVAELAALPPPASPDEASPRMEAAYRAAVGVLDAAGPFERDDLCARFRRGLQSTVAFVLVRSGERRLGLSFR